MINGERGGWPRSRIAPLDVGHPLLFQLRPDHPPCQACTVVPKAVCVAEVLFRHDKRRQFSRYALRVSLRPSAERYGVLVRLLSAWLKRLRKNSIFCHDPRWLYGRRQFSRFAFRAALLPPAGRKGLRPDVYLGLAPQAGIYRAFSALKACS